MNLFTAIDTRASAPRLGAPAPSPEHLDRILSAAVRAPDHGRLAPWRFVVLENETRDVLADAMVEALKHKAPDSNEAALNAERAKVLRAPMIIVVAARVNPAHKVPEIEQVVAVGAAVQNMLLAVHALGYGSMWKTGGGAYDPLVKKALGLESSDHIVAFLYLGTPAATGQPKIASLEGVVRRL